VIRTDSTRRRSPPAAIWLTVAILSVSIVACLAAGLVAWQEAKQVEALEARVGALQSERQETEALIVALQSTATVMENRLSTLEANDPAQQLATLQAAIETASDAEELDSLRTSLSEMQTKVYAFQSTLDDLTARMEALEPGEFEARLPSSVQLEVGLQRQSHNLSCESSAASMVAQYFDLNISEADVLAALPYNDNPYLGFRGNIDGPTGGIEDYGVYAGPVLKVLNNFGIQAWLVQGGVAGIKSAVARGNPVIVWVTYNCLPSTPVETMVGEEAVTLVPNQHVVVVTGYNGDGVWANDPWDGQQDFYPYPDLERAMAYFGDMAIEVAGP
jgi:uncharacterized protein YvpB